jgi:hypothetical protein
MNLRVSILLVLLLSGCVSIPPSKQHSSASGLIEGRVVNQKGKPVYMARVEAVYLRGWTTFYPPVPNAFVVGSSMTEMDGSFKIQSTKRVDKLMVTTRPRGEIFGVNEKGNIIVLKP